MKTKLASFAIILTILLAFAAMAYAAPAGKVTNIDGRVDVTASGQPAKALSIGDTVNVGDVIRTKSASKCEIMWNDGSIARLAENSRLQVTEFNLTKEKRSVSFSLFRGKMHNIVTSVTQLFGAKGSSKYEVHTPTSVCGVRGTTFFAYFQNGVAGAVFTEGTGYGYSKGRPDAVKSITPGQMMVVTSSNRPASLRSATSGEVHRLIKDTTLSEKKKDGKKDDSDKGKGGGGASGSGGGSSSGSGSGSSSEGSSTSGSGTSGSSSGDSSSGGTGGTTGSDSGGTTGSSSTSGGTGGTTGLDSGSTSGSSSSSGGTGGTTLGGDPTLSTGPTSGAGGTGGITLTTTPTTNTTTPITVIPVTPPEPTPPEPIPPEPIPPAPPVTTNTTFTQSVTLGSISGPLDGSISDTTNEGTLNMTGTGQATTSVTTITSGSMSDGSTYDAYLAGMPGSWSGRFAALSNKGGSASILMGSLSDSNYSGSSLSAAGSITRGTAYTTSGSIFNIYDGTLPVPSYFVANNYGEITAYYGQGYYTSTGGLVAVWALTRTDGLSPFSGIAETRTYPYYEYCPYTPFAYLYKNNNLVRTDDASGHFEVKGDIEFMNDRYYGLLSMNTKATRTSEFGDGYYYYNEIGVGNYILDPLKYHGSWGISGGPYSLYYNNSGSMTTAGEEEALIGGTTGTPWTGITDFKAIGKYSYYAGLEGYNYYLWNTKLEGYDPSSSYSTRSSGGYFEGITAGIWKSSQKGSIRAIYVTPVSGGSSTAGLLTSDDIAVTLYPNEGMWRAEGTIGPYSVLTYTGDPTNWVVYDGTSQSMKLSGFFTNSAGSSISGIGYFITHYLSDNWQSSPPWGIYNLQLSGTNTFSGKPLTGDSSWSADLGGRGEFGYGGTPSTGYWLASISNGVWTENGQITGSVSGSYLTPTYKGNIVSSPFYGVNSSSGGWIGESIGIYEGQPLSFSGNIDASIWYYNSTFTDDGYINGLVGSSTPLWGTSSSAPAATTLMGEYSSGYASPYYIFNYETYSNNVLTSQKTTYDTAPGSFFAVYGGTIRNSSLEALTAGLYIDPSGNAGFLKGGLSGSTYSGINMWKAAGSLYRTVQMQAAIGISPENLYNQLLYSTDFGGKIAITDTLQGSVGNVDSYYNKVYSLYNGNTSYPWGIWQTSAVGNYTTASASWTAKAGGSSTFGAYYSGAGLMNDTGYWIADITGNEWSSNKLAGSVSGKFITGNKIGNAAFSSGTGMNGDILGTYSSGMWQAVAMGTWSGTPLAFSTDIDWGNSGYVSGGQMWYDEQFGTSLRGIIGSTASFIGASAPLYGIGTYYAAGTSPLLEMDISKNLNVPNTADSISLWFGGIKTSTSFAGTLMGLYANWNGTNYDVGYATSGSALNTPVTGNLYSGIGMWEIIGGSLTSSAKGTITTQGNVTPNITIQTTNPRISSIAGTQGISGTSNSYDMYFTDIMDWGVWRSENGGTYTGTPTASWKGIAGNKDDQNYSYTLARLTGADWASDIITGTESGRYLTMTSWGRSSGDIMGTYGNGNWQTLSLGKREKIENLAFVSQLNGNLYQVVPGTIYSKEYQRPYWNTPSFDSYFDPLRYETIYFKYGNPETYNPTTTIAFEWADKDGGNYTYKEEYHYYPSGQWVKINKGQGITYTAGSGSTTGVDFSTNPPTSPNFTGTIVADPATPFVSYNNYVLASPSTWSTNAFVHNGAFQGIMGGLNNQSLWTSSSSAKTNLILMGSHDSYNGSQIFGTPLSYTSASNGAYFGALTGIIQDTDATTAYSENPLTGLIIGLYVDPSGKAGVLKGSFTGTSYTVANMWESTDSAGTATFYRDDTIRDQTTSATPGTLLATDANGNYTNIFTGAIGPGINSALYGTFGGNGSIRSPFGIMGKTFSIASQPDWGIFTMQVGLANTYSNYFSATSWTASLFGSAMFGKYDANYGAGPVTYADLGYWHTDLTSGTWTGGKLTGTLSGEFLTLMKRGTLEGSLLGTYDNTTWQATAAGTYAKTQNVSFSSEIWGNSHTLIAGKSGTTTDGTTYNFWYNDQAGPGNYGNSTYYNAANNTKTITRFDIQGPTSAKIYHKDVWVQAPGADQLWATDDDTYTFTTTVYNTLTAYNADMAKLQTEAPVSVVMPFNQMQFHNYNFNGILAGVDNLWTNIAGNAATPIYLMGDIETDNSTPKLFSSMIVSINPLVTVNPYSYRWDSTLNDWVGGSQLPSIKGAYFAYLGGVFGKQTVDYDKIDGMLSGLYRNPADGSIGVLNGTFAGDNDMNIGYWKASGNISGYKLLSATKVYNSTNVTDQNFASLLTQSSNQYSWADPYYVPADPYLGDNSSGKMAFVSSGSVYLHPAYYDKYYSSVQQQDVAWADGSFGVYNFAAGGTYDPSATPNYKNARTYTSGDDITHYGTTDWDTTLTNGIRNGSVLHNGIFNPATATGHVQVNIHSSMGITQIMGADIKGLFDPVAATWQMVGSGKFMETAAFVNLVNSFTTDAEKNAFMAAMKIPCINVGQVDLIGSRGTAGNSLSVNMNGVNFYSYSTGQTPRLFATNSVTGSYDVSSLGGALPAAVNLNPISVPANLSFGTNAVQFTPTAWNTSTNKWAAEVKGTATLTPGTSGNISYTGPTTNITFKGGAAGNLAPTQAPTMGTFGGTAAGVVR